MVKPGMLYGASDVSRTARDLLARRRAVEIFPPALEPGEGDPFIPALRTTALGRDWVLAQGGRATLIEALKVAPDVFSLTVSHRAYDTPQPNRLLGFHYLQFAQLGGIEELLAFTRELFGQLVAAARASDWLPGERAAQLAQVNDDLPTVDFATFHEASGAAEDDMSLAAELAGIQALGDRPILVRNYRPAAKPNIPDVRRVTVNGEERLLNFSILAPGVGSILDGAELENNPAVLKNQLEQSSLFAAARARSDDAPDALARYVALYEGLEGRTVSLGGMGLERNLQFLAGAPGIDATIAFPLNWNPAVLDAMA